MVSCRFIVCNENQESDFEELVTSSIGRKCLSHMQGTVSAWLKAQYQCSKTVERRYTNYSVKSGARCGKPQLETAMS